MSDRSAGGGDGVTAPGEPSGKLGQLSREERARLFEKLRQKKSTAPPAAADGPPLAAVPRDPTGLPLSFSQERLWLLDLLTPGTSIYNLPLAVRLRGPFDPAVLALCFAEVRRRHEVLRTTFALRGDEPVQVIHPPGPFPLPCADLADLPEAARRAEARRLADRWSTAPFDLERGPLLRALLLRLAPEEHGLLLGQHHIITDGWSRTVLLREVAALYEAFAAGRPSPLPELPVQYADVAVWQRARLQGEALQEQLAWWRERLAGAPESLELPLDRARPAVQTFRGGSLRSVLPSDLAGRLHDLARSERASLFMVLLAGLSLLLHRWSGEEDLLVGTPIAGRTRPELDGLIGFFLNSLTLRVDLSGQPTGRALLGRAREAALGAYAHQEVPFEKLLADLRPERDLSRTPLFQVFLNLLNFPDSRALLPGGLVLELLADDWLDSKFDLTLYALEAAEGLQLVLVYNADLFERPRMEEMQRQLRKVFEQLVADPDAPVDAVSLLTAEAAALLPDPADPLGNAWHGAVHELFAAQALKAPERPAVIDAEGAWSYGDLADAAARLAAALRAGGVSPGDPVALWAHRGAPLVWAVMGTLWAGGAFVILDPAYPGARLAETVRLAAPRFWLEVGAAGPPPREVEEALRGPGGEGPPRLTLPGGGPAGAAGLLTTLPPPVSPARTAPDDLAYIAFTSGSTGAPKGILGRHGPLSHFLPFQRERFGLGEGDRYSLLSGLSHDPLQRDIFTPLCLGAALCAPDPEDMTVPGRLAGWMARQGITVAHLTPAMAQLLTEAEDGAAVPSLRWVLLVGDILTRLDVDRLRRLAPGVTCVNLYGSTETQRAVGHHVVEEREIADERAPQVLPLGRGMRDVQLLVTGRGAALRLAGVGEVGEIWVRSPHLARGYLGDEALTADRFRTNPFTGAPGDRVYRTGDLGRYRADGEVTFAGRADQQVKIRGFRIEPGEIEAALGRLPGVREAVVLAHGEGSDRRLVAYVTGNGINPGNGIDPAALRDALRARLPIYMVPADFVPLDRLPVTPNGKVDRRALARIDPEGPPGVTADAAFVEPRTPLEQRLAEVWRELLGRERVGRHDNFFDVGGHSLAAMRLLTRVRAAFGVELPLRLLFEKPTLEEMARAIAEAESPHTADIPLVPVPRDPAGLPLSFSQERLWFLDRLTPGTATYNLPARARLRGPLDPARLERCLTEIRRRHEALRTRFALRAGAPVQLIDPPEPFVLPVVDLAGLPEEARRREAERQTAAEAARPFDLERGPLWRALLLRLGAEEHGLLLTLHHIVTDGWSMSILFRELAVLYEGAAALPGLPVQGADAAAWQRARLSGPALEARLAFWRERLAGSPAALDLPLDRARPAVQTFRGEEVPLLLPPDLAGRLRFLARREGATLFMTLLAGLDLLLSRWSGQDDVLVGTPVAGRGRPELEGLIGFFLNTLVLRVDLSGEPSLRELLGRAREAALGAYAHQDLPFERLLEDLQPERDLSRTPLFQVFLNLLSFPEAGARLPDGLALEPLEGAGPESMFDLTVYAAEPGEAVALRLLYNADLFDRARMEELMRQLRGVLERLADDPEAAAGSVSLLTAEAAALLPDPAALLGDDWHGAVHALFAERARRHPERLAVTDAEASWTYGELADAAARLAARLRADGLAPGDPVAIWAHRSAPVAWAVMGTLWAGGAFVLLDPAYPPARLAETIRLASPRFWLEVAAAGTPPPEVEEALRALAAEGTLLGRLTLPGGGPAGAAALLAALPPPVEPAAVGPDDLALLAFTSGSTGAPKGIEGRHGPLSHFLPFQQERFGLTEADRYSLLSGLSHDPLQRDLFTPLCLGGSLCAPSFEETATPGRLAAWMAREGITVAHLTPAMAQLLTETGGGPLPSIPTLRRVLLVGDVLTRLDVDRLRRIAPGATCVNLYGSTETQRAVGHHIVEEREVADERAPQVLPLGRGMRDVQLLVVSRTAAAPPRLAGIGEVGEIWVRSPHLARGYRGDEMLTADRFRTNPFTAPPDTPGDRVYRTGDLGRYRADGEVTFAGRADQQVKIRGFRIELGEIEAALGRLPGVREAVVLARERAGDRRLVAYLTGEGINSGDGLKGLETAALREALRARLPAYMVPSAFVPLDRLPVTPNGKVDRRALAKIDLEGLDAGLASAYVAPRSGLEERIAAVWCEVLGLERVGVRHNFFDLGGHSLLLVRLHARLQEALGRELTLVDLFNYPSVESLAAHLDRAAEAPEALEQARGRAQRQIDAARRQKELARARRGRPGGADDEAE